MLFELRWDWVDIDRRVIRIPIEFRTVGNKGVPVAIPLSTRAVNVIHNLPRSLDGRLLSTSPNAARCVWKRTLKEIGIKGLRWHDLRHEAASRLFEKGLHPLEVASITGHKSLTMLRRYTHLRPEDLALKLA
jgi:integrase